MMTDRGMRRPAAEAVVVREVFSSRRFRVEERDYVLPGGGRTRKHVVVHPGAVAILPILDDGRLVLIRSYRFHVHKVLWELPAGTREPDESPDQTARRELEEETGYRASIVEPLAEFFTSPGLLTERMYVFVAHGLVHVGQRLEDAERIEVFPRRPLDVRRMLLEGAFEDAKTMAVLGVYFLRRGLRPNELV
jgi:ADP-ribose pyrophosphatase